MSRSRRYRGGVPDIKKGHRRRRVCSPRCAYCRGNRTFRNRRAELKASDKE